MQKKVTLSLDDELYANFQKYCEDNEVMLSKRVERLIREHMDDNSTAKSKKSKGEK